MPHYKNAINKLFWIDSSSDEHYLPPDCTPATDEQVAAIRLAEFVPPSPEQIKNAADIAFAKAYVKLNTLSNMTPQQLQTYITNNVTNVAQIQDALYTLALAVGILWRDKK